MKPNQNVPASGEREQPANAQRDLDQNKTQQANKAGQTPNNKGNNASNQKITDDDLNPRADENEEEDDADQEDDSDTDKKPVEKTGQSGTNPKADKPGMRNSGEPRREQR